MVKWSIALLFALVLASCSPARVFFADPVTVLAAPELVQAWNNAAGPSDRFVPLASDASEVASLLRASPASGALVAAPVTPAQLEAWHKQFPSTRFVVLSPSESSAQPSPQRLVGARQDAWLALTRRAAGDAPAGAKALVLVPPNLPAETQAHLAQAWSADGRSAAQVLPWTAGSASQQTTLKEALRAGTTDLLVLGVDPTQVPLDDAPPSLRVHRDWAWAGQERFAGWRLVLDAAKLGRALHGALDAQAPPIADLPWEIVKKTPLSRS